MSLDSKTGIGDSEFESAAVFAQPPFRSRQFLASTSVVALLVILDILMLVRFFNRVPLFTSVGLLFVLLTVVLNWMRVVTVHRRLHELYLSIQTENNPPNSPIEVALGSAASLSYWGTLAVAATGLAALGALTQVIRPG